MRYFEKSAVVICLVLIAACGGSGDEPTPAPPAASSTLPATSTTPLEPTSTATPSDSPATGRLSDDGVALLEFSQGALPEGVSIEDIKAVALDPADVDAGEGVEVVAAYELLPDGLVLNSPAFLTFPVGQLEEDAFYLVSHVSGDDIEFPPTELHLSESGDYFMSVEVAHFSRVRLFILNAVRDFGQANVALPNGKTHPFGNPFPASVSWSVDPSNPTKRIPLHGGTLLVDPPRQAPSHALEVLVSFDAESLSLTGSSAQERGRAIPDDLFRLTQVSFMNVQSPLALTFVCKGEGITGIGVVMALSVETDYEFFRDGRTVFEGTFSPHVNAKGSTTVQCVFEPTQAPETVTSGPETVTPGSDDPAAVTAAEINMRGGPGAAYALVETLPAGSPVTLLARSADSTWVRVRTGNGAEGWLNAAFILTSDSINDLPIEDPPPAQPEDPEPNSAPIVDPIEVEAHPTQEGTHILSVVAIDPDGDTLTHKWSGFDCTPPAITSTATVTWTHNDQAKCGHLTPAHGNALITVVISDGLLEVQCTHTGVTDIVSPACVELPAG